ncbi:MAG: HPr family phosphocarrier protein [Desulfobacterales bacterium]|uniref:HPr family phosphocarrier protein n=1 Tax=Candidatus Desulfatibia profunda TaxID=2841695 RepID=A0A8J6NNZ2_9BACT|nr:HPr family phosphocarrier protein [Candidatus Desulfatibia profunda]MBL7178677.1 HPr family phosphocarrier protein [Desulfobacterales bacterium]
MDGLDKELTREVVIVNTLGLHARAAAKIAKCVQNAKSNIWIIKDDTKADASRIIDILTLVCVQGSKITIKINDRADLEKLNDLVKLVEKGFEE